MKYKIKKKYYLIFIVVIGLILSLSFAYASSFFMKNLSSKSDILEKELLRTKNKNEKHADIKKYVKEKADVLVDEIDINSTITDVVTKENNMYESKIFNYQTGEEVSIKDLIHSEYLEEFYTKVKSLIKLKYPDFIADVLINLDKKNTYYLKDNELVIYFYDYEIEPMPKEDLFLKVNYNEIKDYLNIEVSLDSSYQNEDGNRIDPNKKLIAITFDDGPGPYTSNLTDILISNKSRATFFMLGKNISKYKNSVLKIHNNNMEIAYHSYAHKNFLRQEVGEVLDELEESNDILKSITGNKFHLIRPPYGSINKELKEALDNPIILWSIDTEDWRHKNTEYLENYTLEHASDGAIILFHDIHKTSVETMKTLLPKLYVEGYQVVTVSDLAKSYNTDLESHLVYHHFVK